MMTKPTDHWMPFYVEDYLRDTTRLTIEEHGAYVLLIIDYWVKGPPPDDDGMLATITKSSKKEWQKLRKNLIGFFTVSDGVWRHKRIDHERGRAHPIVEQRQAAGRASAQARANKRSNGRVNETSTSVATAEQRRGQRNGNGEANETADRRHKNQVSKYNLNSETNNPAREEGEDDLQKFNGVLRGRYAPSPKRDHLVQKLNRFCLATMSEPELSLSIIGLLGDDPDHDPQWWLDHLDRLMRAQHWDDTARLSA
jgi:uncharacterized protein YdaU (DUF1376 family)